MIELKGVTKKYDKTIFENLNFQFKDQQITCIIGESGIGKTTLLKMIAGLTDYQGSIDGVGKISYIFQEDRLILNLTVLKNLQLICPDKSIEEIREMLQLLKIEDKMYRYPRELSGGEAKRVSIARAFLYDGDVILMDEPFSSLDLSLKLDLIRYFSDLWAKKSKTVLFVTHDVDEALLLAHEIYIMKDGFLKDSLSLKLDLPRQMSDVVSYRTEMIEKLIHR